MSRRNINSCTDGVDLSVFDFIKWLMSSNNSIILFVFKDTFYRRIKLAMLLFIYRGCSYRALCSGRCNKSVRNRRFAYSLIAPY